MLASSATLPRNAQYLAHPDVGPPDVRIPTPEYGALHRPQKPLLVGVAVQAVLLLGKECKHRFRPRLVHRRGPYVRVLAWPHVVSNAPLQAGPSVQAQWEACFPLETFQWQFAAEDSSTPGQRAVVAA